jgi:hypothetical protein
MGINIDLNNVNLNSGLRYISKLLLNSLWGKFGQRNNLTKTVVIKSPAEYFALTFDKSLDIKQIMCVARDMMRVTYAEKESMVKESSTNNVVLALFTTRYRFLKFHKTNLILQCCTFKTL